MQIKTEGNWPHSYEAGECDPGERKKLSFSGGHKMPRRPNCKNPGGRAAWAFPEGSRGRPLNMGKIKQLIKKIEPDGPLEWR